MIDYTELVEALRCKNTGDDECGSSDCPYWSGLGCMDGQLMEDAADAIEALQAENPIVETVLEDKMRQQMEELQQKWFKSETDATNLTGKLAQAEADIDRLNLEIDKRIATEIELSNQVDALQAQLPKRGKWLEREVIHDRADAKITDWQQAKCSLCNKWHTTPYMYSFIDYNYCPNCGAKMEAQDGQ